jgi:hypothetical protein
VLAMGVKRKGDPRGTERQACLGLGAWLNLGALWVLEALGTLFICHFHPFVFGAHLYFEGHLALAAVSCIILAFLHFLPWYNFNHFCTVACSVFSV